MPRIIFPQYEQGTPETLWKHGHTIAKYPTEIEAMNHAYAPDNPQLGEATNTAGTHFLVCSKCGRNKPFNQFDADSRNTGRGGKHSHCKECRNKKRR